MPGRAAARSLLMAAGLSAVGMATLAYWMAFPVRWDGPGKAGAVALIFPLHLLPVAVAGVVLAFSAKRRHARLAARAFIAVAIGTALLALTPTLLLWQRAREWNVPLSLRTYLAYAAHWNGGEPVPHRSVVYGTAADGTQLELDAWLTGRPKSGPLRPAVVMVHGGGWVHGTRSMLPDWDRWLNELGYEVFDVEYRMPPPVRWLDEVGDVKSALGWLATHAAEYHVDPARISVMGGSAGANLSLLAAYSSGDPRLPPSTDVPPLVVRSVVNCYGPTDLALLYRTCESPGYVRPLLKAYLGGDPDEQPERYRLLSPLAHVSSKSPPTLTLLGTSDRLVTTDHATALDRALATAGVPHETCLLPATDHGFDVNWGGFATQIARAKVQAFLARH